MSAPVCRYYLNGTCRFGDRCRFSHVELTDSSEEEDSYIPSSRRSVYFKSGHDDRVVDYVPDWREKYGFSTGRQAVRREPRQGLGNYKFSTDDRAVYRESQRQPNKYGSKDDARCNAPSSPHRHVGSHRSVTWNAPTNESEDDDSCSSEVIQEIVDKIQQEAKQS